MPGPFDPFKISDPNHPFGGGAVPPYPGLSVYDEFTDANGVLLPAHAPTKAPAAWVAAHGTMDIQSNRASWLANGAGGFSAQAIDSGRADCSIGAICKSASLASEMSVIFRYVDSANFILANLSDSSNAVRLIQRLANVVTVPTSVALTIATNTDYAVEVVLSGTSVKIYVDGVLRIDTTNANFATATKHGLYAQEAATFDEFQVTQ